MTIYDEVLQRANERTAQRKQEQVSRVKLIARPVDVSPIGKKLCRVCQQWLDYAEFSPQKRTADKLQTECRACHRLWWHKRKAALR